MRGRFTDFTRSSGASIDETATASQAPSQGLQNNSPSWAIWGSPPGAGVSSSLGSGFGGGATDRRGMPHAHLSVWCQDFTDLQHEVPGPKIPTPHPVLRPALLMENKVHQRCSKATHGTSHQCGREKQRRPESPTRQQTSPGLRLGCARMRNMIARNSQLRFRGARLHFTPCPDRQRSDAEQP